MREILNLQLFADGGDSGATGDNAGTDAGFQKTGGTSQAAAETGAPRTGAEAEPSFDELLKRPEIKAAYDERVKKAIDGRFKKAKAMEARQAEIEPILELLGGKYGVTYGPDMDLAALRDAVMDDDAYYEEEAEARHMSVEGLKQLRKLERDNRRLTQAEEQRKRDEAWNGIVRQAEAAKAKFPGLDLEVEMKNPAFGRLLAGGVPVEAAYKAVHMDEIMSAGMQYAVRSTQEQTVNAIMSGQNRPRENGMGGGPPATNTTDPRKFTPEERKRIRERVARGERVEF